MLIVWAASRLATIKRLQRLYFVWSARTDSRYSTVACGQLKRVVRYAPVNLRPHSLKDVVIQSRLLSVPCKPLSVLSAAFNRQKRDYSWAAFVQLLCVGSFTAKQKNRTVKRKTHVHTGRHTLHMHIDNQWLKWGGRGLSPCSNLSPM